MDAHQVGPYRLERLIGSGGMGDVYEAVDLERDRVVALKLLPALFSGNAEFQQRFRRESRVAARLRDPHIIPIHDYGEIHGRLFIDMRLVDDGGTVATILRDEGPMAPSRAVHLIEQVAEALDAAHADGLVHRDIKPSNVLVTARDFVYVVDFGIAHAVGHTASGLTLSGATVGTLDYMAPERFGNRALDRRADVYSLACLFHQCLTARTPFDGEDLPALMYAHLNVDPPRPSDTRAAVPAALDEVVARGMAKSPGDRYASAGHLADAARAGLTAGRAGTSAGTSVGASNGSATASSTARYPDEAAAVVVAAGAPAPTRPLEPSGPGGPPSSAAPPGSGVPSAKPRPREAPESSASWVAESPPPSPPPSPPSSSEPPGEPTTTVHTRPQTDGPPPPRPRRTPGRGLLLVAGALVLIVLVGLGIGLTLSGPRPAPSPVGAVIGPPDGGRSPLPASLPQPTVADSVATPPAPGYLAVAPGGRIGYLTNVGPRVVTVLDLVARTTIATIPIPQAPPHYVAVTADGSRAFVSAYTEDDATNVVAVVDTRTNTVTATIPVDRRPYALAVSPDQRTLWVPSHNTAQIDLIDIATNTITRRLPVAPNPHWVAFDGNRAFVSNHESNLVTVLDATTADTLATFPLGPSPHALAVSPDGSRLAVVLFDGDAVAVADPATNRVIASVPVGHHPQHVSWAPDGRHLYVANVDGGTVSVVDTATYQVTATVPVGRSPTSVTTVTPPGTSAVVTVLDDARYTVLDTGR